MSMAFAVFAGASCASMPSMAAQAAARITEPGQMVRAEGARWVTADGNLQRWMTSPAPPDPFAPGAQ